MGLGEHTAGRGASGGRKANSGQAESGGGLIKPGTVTVHRCLEPGEAQARTAELLRAIEGEIVPRLVLARRAGTGPEPTESGASIGETDVKELVRLLLSHDVGIASAYLETILQRGAGFEEVCLSLLAPAARELGLLWEEDECDFMQVTVGLCRLHQLLRELRPAMHSQETQKVGERTILLAPAPGDQHTFGITVVAQFLLQAGWQVWSEFSNEADRILKVVRTQWFAAVGLSVGSETRLDEVIRLVQEIRRVSLNRSVGVMVGGALLVTKPEIAVAVGADATATDGLMAVKRAEEFFDGVDRSA